MPGLRILRLASVAFVSLCLVSLAPAPSHAADPIVVPDGIAHCQWLKIKAKASGYELLDGDAGLGPKRSLVADCYMQLVFMPGGGNPHGKYGAPLLCPVDFQNWAASPMQDSFSGVALQDGNVIAVDNYLTFTNAASDVIQGWGTHRILITIDKKTGAFKKASFQTLGAEMIDDSTYNLTPAFVMGSFSVTGSSVTPDKVPAEAKQLVTDSPCP
jgi:hypothetical protein